MKITDVKDLKGTNREVHCPKGGFISNRILLKSDGMGYTLTKTEIPKGDWHRWHYKYHKESCYCESGKGVIYDVKEKRYHSITPGVTYILDKNDDHKFVALEDMVLICVFSPALEGNEVHSEDGSYKPAEVF